MRAFVYLIAILGSGYLAWQFMYPSVTLRYRLTLRVEADGATHTGSGVLQVTYAKAVQLLGSSRAINIDVEGEAIPVDIGSRGTLFALMKAGEWSRSSPEWIVPNAFGVIRGGFEADLRREFARLKTVTGAVNLDLEQVPMLVRFRDLSDPRTVERIDPRVLDVSFGAGARLISATLEITRDPVTQGIKNRLPWLARVENNLLDGQRFGGGPALSNILDGSHFMRCY